MTDNIWPQFPKPSVTVVQPEGGVLQLTTVAQKRSFEKMVINTLTDVLPGHRIAAVPAQEVMLALCTKVKRWDEVPVGWAQLSSALEAALANQKATVVQMKNVRTVVQRAFELAAKNEMEYKPSAYPDGLTGKAYREMENRCMDFFAKPNDYFVEGNKQYNDHVLDRCDLCLEYLGNRGLSSPVTKQSITDFSRQFYLGKEFGEIFVEKMNVAYDELCGAANIPYVNLPGPIAK